jgi:PIN domain nuclease of toxin-antitoxin system
VGVRRVLLDTHALLWALLEPERIPPATLEAVRDPDTALLVSAASAWEIAIKYRLGRMDGAEAVVEGYTEHLERLRAEELAISGRQVLTAGAAVGASRPVRPDHRGPVHVESVSLVTADRALSSFPGVDVMCDPPSPLTLHRGARHVTLNERRPATNPIERCAR